MKIAALAAAIVIGGGIALFAPSTAEAMPRGVAPVDVTQNGVVEKVHGRHCRIRRGHRSRCRSHRRARHRHRHCHRSRCHRHRHYSGHHRGGRGYYRPGFRGGLYLRLY